ncbi:MAG: hypothetical protein HFF50_10615 [Lawsonibacter sp.]|nr:hypothetical protein [Lawsonibacter sp.]
MEKQLQELFCDEVDRKRLVFEDSPQYNKWYAQSEALFPNGDLPAAVFHLLEISNCIAFTHGFRLGLRLKRWAEY